MRSASGGYVRVAQRLSEEDTKARELQKVESGSGNPDSYNKTDKLNDGSIIKTTRLAIVTTHCRGKSMLKAWFRSNLDAQPLEPPPPRQWPFSLTLLFLLPVLLVTFIGCNYWLSPYIQPAPTKNSNDDVSLHPIPLFFLLCALDMPKQTATFKIRQVRRQTRFRWRYKTSFEGKTLGLER